MVSNIFGNFTSTYGKWSNLTDIYDMGWNHQLETLTWQWKKGKHIWRWHLLLQHADVPASHSFLFVGCIPVKISADGACSFQKNILTGYPGEGESRQQWHGCVLASTCRSGPGEKNNGTLCWSLGKKGPRSLPSNIGIIINHHKDPY